jgi:hypothetical protein
MLDVVRLSTPSREVTALTLFTQSSSCPSSLKSHPSHYIPHFALTPRHFVLRVRSRLMSARPYPIPNPPLPLPDRSPPYCIHPRPPRPRFRLFSLHSPIPLSNSPRSRRRHSKRIQFNPTPHFHYRPSHLGAACE